MSGNDYESRIWRRLAEIAEEAVEPLPGADGATLLFINGDKFVELLRKQADGGKVPVPPPEPAP